MRNLLLLFLFGTMISCKKNGNAVFDIHIQNADQFDKAWHDLYTIEIYKNDRIFRILEPEEHAPSLKSQIKIDSLEDGKYAFVYESIFGDKIKKEIEVDGSKVYRVNINPDTLNRKTEKSVFGNIKDGAAKLVYKSSGCFHKEEDSLVIINKANNYFIRQRNGNIKPIDRKIWSYFVRAENRIRHIPEDGECTTKDIYIFYDRGKIDTIKDGTCHFSVWNTLENYLKKNKLK